MKHIYLAIDLKSFYASVECIERDLNPLDTNLVVADNSRTDKTICLAVSPALKSLGVPGRPRLFEVNEKVRQLNSFRRAKLNGKHLTEKSYILSELQKKQDLAIDFIIAPPRMAHYIKYSTDILNVYLKYIAPEDIHVYSIDEVFIDISHYLKTYGLSPMELCQKMVKDVYTTTGITATAGIGTNLYLAKIAMDIVAKKMPADKNGVRIAYLDEQLYRQQLWTHQPLTDFWRVGKGYAKKLEQEGLYTMGDIALCSTGSKSSYYNEELLYKLFGINAELLIDHAWGYEPCTIEQIKAYRPSKHSICCGQVLHTPYTTEKGEIVIKEMADSIALDLTAKSLVTDQLVLTIGYDRSNLDAPETRSKIDKIRIDHYGRQVPEHSHGTIHLNGHTSLSNEIINKATELYRRIVKPQLLIRRFSLTADNTLAANQTDVATVTQLSLFDEPVDPQVQAKRDKVDKLQHTVIDIKKRFGKNSLLRGLNYEDGATGRERNAQIGGHKA